MNASNQAKLLKEHTEMSTNCTSAHLQHVPPPVTSELKDEKIQICHEVYRPNENWQLQPTMMDAARYKIGRYAQDSVKKWSKASEKMGEKNVLKWLINAHSPCIEAATM